MIDRNACGEQPSGNQRTLADASSIRRAWLVNTAIWVVVAIGIFLRLSQWWLDRSLFLDEAFVANNIQDRGIIQLLGTLEYDQRAPYTFLIGVKAFWELFGPSDLALRAIPLIAGILSLFVFRSLASKVLNDAFQFVAVSIFAIAVPQIYYSAELKQYSTDVLIAITALNLLLTEPFSLSDWKRTFFFGCFGILAFQISFVSVFIFFAAGISLLFRAHGKLLDLIPKLITVGSMWLVGFVLIYLIQLRWFDPDPDWKSLWSDSFLNAPLFSLSSLQWFRDQFVHVATIPAGLAPTSIACVLLIFGSIRLTQSDPVKAFCLASPILVTLFAAVAGVYPFSGRVILFTAPSVILMVAYGIQQQVELKREVTLLIASLAAFALKDRGTALGVITTLSVAILLWRATFKSDWSTGSRIVSVGRTAFLIGSIWWLPTREAFEHLSTRQSYCNPTFQDYRHEEMKPLMQFIRDNWQANDKVYLYSQSNVAFRFYAPRFGFQKSDWYDGMLAGLFLRSSEQVEKELSAYKGHKRLWILFTHVGVSAGDSDRHLYLGVLDSIGIRRSELLMTGRNEGAVYLYDLSSSE